jgi:hypothetical protein
VVILQRWQDALTAATRRRRMVVNSASGWMRAAPSLVT